VIRQIKKEQDIIVSFSRNNALYFREREHLGQKDENNNNNNSFFIFFMQQQLMLRLYSLIIIKNAFR
jgi:hypothetical protein